MLCGSRHGLPGGTCAEALTDSVGSPKDEGTHRGGRVGGLSRRVLCVGPKGAPIAPTATPPQPQTLIPGLTHGAWRLRSSRAHGKAQRRHRQVKLREKPTQREERFTAHSAYLRFPEGRGSRCAGEPRGRPSETKQKHHVIPKIRRVDVRLRNGEPKLKGVFAHSGGQLDNAH